MSGVRMRHPDVALEYDAQDADQVAHLRSSGWQIVKDEPEPEPQPPRRRRGQQAEPAEVAGQPSKEGEE